MIHHIAAMLPFVQYIPGQIRSFWSPDRSGSYGEAVERGKHYGRQLISALQELENPALFGSVVRSIAVSGVYGPVEIGFCQEIGAEMLGCSTASAAADEVRPATCLLPA